MSIPGFSDESLMADLDVLNDLFPIKSWKDYGQPLWSGTLTPYFDPKIEAAVSEMAYNAGKYLAEIVNQALNER